ncbi:hypothetical protein AAVH_26114 [Aphelenchoides avenae]|nr:hypothetical protein AAVH_26114 [Aphelenchus avenae]
MLKELPAVRRGRSNISFDNLGLIMSFLDRVVVEKCELVCRSWRSCVSRHSSALPLHRIWLSKQACREKQGSCDVFIDMINYSSEYSLDEDDRHIDGCSIALSLAWNVRRRLKDSFIVTFKADDDGGIGCDSQSMPNEWCRNLLSTITCGIGELFITLSGAGNVSILQHLSHFINRSSTKRIVLDTWRHSSEILPWITSPDFYLSDAAQTAKSLRVQFNWEVRRFVGPIDASSAWSQLYYALPEMDELDVCIASYDDRVTSWAMSNLPGRIVQAEETVKAPRLIVRLNAGNWRFCMPPPRQHHIGVKVPRWDFAATDDDQVHDEEIMTAPKLLVWLAAGNCRLNVPAMGLLHIGVKVPEWDYYYRLLLTATDDEQDSHPLGRQVSGTRVVDDVRLQVILPTVQ